MKQEEKKKEDVQKPNKRHQVVLWLDSELVEQFDAINKRLYDTANKRTMVIRRLILEYVAEKAAQV